MLKHIFIFLLLGCFTTANSQIHVDFEGNSLGKWEQSTPEHWSISKANSISENSSLHHSYDNTSSGHDQIVLPLGQLNLASPVTWKFKIRHSYNPSSSNNWSVFLFTDGGANQVTPDNHCNAFVLGVNFTDSDDFLKIWRKSGVENKVLANTNFNWQDSIDINDFVEFEIKFTYPESWKIRLFKTKNMHADFIFDFFSRPHINIGYNFGIYYKYSSLQDQKIWFDDLEINGKFIIDTTPPKVTSIDIQQSLVGITFSEPIDRNSIKENSISILPGLQYVSLWETPTQLNLHLATGLVPDKEYSLTLNCIKDLNGNSINDTIINIRYSIAQQNDIIITEIMTDPIPAIFLPEQEFIEIYNRTSKNFNLDNYSIWVCGKQQIIHSGKILPGEYIIICDDNDVEEFTDFGKIIEITSLPNLTKISGTITLRNNIGQLVHQVDYTDDVFLSETKQQGGWTLEMIDTDNPCHFENNWRESEDIYGGTPGRQNSIFNDNKDFELPKIKNISVTSDTSIQILFNETVDSLYTSQHITFNLDEFKNFKMIDFENIEVNLSEPVPARKLYELNLTGVRDCVSNEIDNAIYYPFAKTEEPDSLDIVFNEIMFDPEPDLPEYIEIVNASNRFLDLSNLTLAKQKSTIEFDTYPITKTPTLFLPEQLAVLSKSNDLIFNNYSTNQEAVYLELEKFPVLTNTSGVLALQDSTGRIIDIFEYTESMHFDLLKETKGVALEKINMENPSLDRNNWQSASASENYATPGWPNSQMFNGNSAPYTPFTIEPEVFSPNNDGYNDELHIRYYFNETGVVINIRIYDAKGRLINQLANNFLCGIQGEFIWRGENFNNNYALNGIYLIYIEYFDLNGNTNRKKETCVLAR